MFWRVRLGDASRLSSVLGRGITQIDVSTHVSYAALPDFGEKLYLDKGGERGSLASRGYQKKNCETLMLHLMDLL